MEENILFKEISKYLHTPAMTQLSSISARFKESRQSLDMHFWKSKLEYEYDVTLDWMDVNWAYVYSLFEGKDPKSVAYDYCYDWMVVKIAHDLGADFDSHIETNYNPVLEDPDWSIRRKHRSPLYITNDIYLRCVMTNSYKSLTWLLTNVPPSVNTMTHLVSDSILGASDGIIEIILDHIGGPTNTMARLLVDKYTSTSSKVGSLETYLQRHRIKTREVLDRTISEGISNELDPDEFMRVLIQNTDRDIFTTVIHINYKYALYIQATCLMDETLLDILLDASSKEHLLRTASGNDMLVLAHFLNTRHN